MYVVWLTIYIILSYENGRHSQTVKCLLQKASCDMVVIETKDRWSQSNRQKLAQARPDDDDHLPSYGMY